MKKLVAGLPAVAASAPAKFFIFPARSSENTVGTTSIATTLNQSMAFQPERAVVKRFEAVEWFKEDASVHTVVSMDRLFDTC
ncbi:MAG: hypothetical protein QXX19_06345 [Candidatus Caldarchaeum sp.]